MFKLVLIALLLNAFIVNGDLSSEEDTMDEEESTSEEETVDEDSFDFNLSSFLKLASKGMIMRKIHRENVTQECQRDLTDFVNGVFESKTWALEMFDSMEKFPSGLIRGRKVIVGSFTECISVKRQNFIGKHCLVEAAILKNTSYLPWPNNAFEREQKNQFSYGICIPSTCSTNDVKHILKSSGLQYIFTIDLNETSCSTGAYQDFRAEDWTTIVILCLVVLLSLGSTVYELYYLNYEKGGNRNSFLISFSLYNNGKQLFDLSENYSELKALNGCRFISITWVVLGHLFSSFYHGYYRNNLEAVLVLNEKGAVPATNGYVSVDTFFFLSGMLCSFVFFKDISKKGNYDAPLRLIYRYLRLTPPLAVVILVQATVFSRFGNGPVWKQDTDAIEKACRTTWWTNFLYIDNFNCEPLKCLMQSWYLSADMQMFLFSIIVLYFLYLLPKFGVVILFSLTVVNTIISFFECYTNELPPSLSYTNRVKGQSTVADFREYRQFYTRMGPYNIGIATGYILCGVMAKKIKVNLSKKWVFLGWTIATALCLGSLYGIIGFLPIGSDHSILEYSFYRTFHRLGWTLGIAWVVFACVVGYGGPVNYILGLNFFQPLAKLSYGIFLVHRFVQIYRFSNTKITAYYRNEDVVYSVIGDVVLSTALAIPLTLLFEIPFNNIGKLLLQNSKILPLPKKVETFYVKEKEEVK